MYDPNVGYDRTVTLASHGPIDVQLSQSDRTPPVLKVIGPVNGSTVRDSTVTLVFEATDNRAIWFLEHSLPNHCSSVSYGAPAPNVTGTVRYERALCSFLERGTNRIVISAGDVALNVTTDTIAITYDPTARVASHAPTRMTECQRPFHGAG